MSRKLANVFRTKIVLTIALCIWMFFAGLFSELGFPVPVPDPIIFLKLLGMAYGALLVGYCFGLVAVRRGEYPKAAIWVGIVSNGGATIILVGYAISGYFFPGSSYWLDWDGYAPLVMLLLLLAVSGITAGLFIYGIQTDKGPGS